MVTYSSSYVLPFAPLVILLAGKCNLAMSGRGALVFWSNPLTQTNPALQLDTEYKFFLQLKESINQKKYAVECPE